jgi:prepilin-type N-terminal cleavage/methylation domain-containing protein
MRRAGFTLPELMLSIVLLAIGMLSVASLMAASHRQQRLAVSRSGLAVLAEAKIDSLRSFGFASTELGTVATETAEANLRANLAVGGSLTSNVSGYSDVVTAPNGRSYDRRWQISNDFTTANSALTVRRITVRLVAQNAAAYEVTTADYSTLIWFQ